ncbi:MAG TPA: GerMN domain-containing protein [Candidatus Paceibacterota bacterium]
MNKTTSIIIGIVIILLVGFAIVVSGKKANAPVAITNFEECVAAGNPIQESYPERCTTPDGLSFTKQIDPNDMSQFIVPNNPQPNGEISSGIELTGKANWYFEGSFPVYLLDANGVEMTATPATAQGEWMTSELTPYKAVLNYSTPTTPTGTIVLHNDNASGLPENDKEVRIPVKFKEYNPDQKLTKVKVYFNNSTQKAECEKVIAIERSVPETQAIARAALDELLKGVMSSELKNGYQTSIQSGVKVKSLDIKNGTATVDFSKELGVNAAGSCHVGAVRAQIEQTLKQFSTVKKVVISIEGNSKDILQP